MLLCRAQLHKSCVIQAIGEPLPRMNCYSQHELQTSRVKWEEQILNGKGTKIHRRAMNESAIIYYLRARQTTMLLTGTLDITAISCNYWEMMRTEHLIAWGMAHRNPTLTRDSWLSFFSDVYARVKNKGPSILQKKKKDYFYNLIWGSKILLGGPLRQISIWTLEVFQMPALECVSDMRTIPTEH